MTVFQSFILGIIQGLTEFIPVSSTAHLLIGQKLLGIPSSDVVFSFLVLVQLGTILALVVYFWKDLWRILLATLKSVPSLFKRGTGTLDLDARLGWFILLATIPALIVGYLLRSAVETLFQTPLLEAAIRLLITALILYFVEWLARRNRSLEQMTWLDSILIGLAQVIAVFPGASRSGTTIGAGMALNLDRPSAARFAFLMSVPIMVAAGVYQSVDGFTLMVRTEHLPVLAVGILTAAVVGWLAVKWLLSYLNRHSLNVFAAYCGVLGLTCLVLALL